MSSEEDAERAVLAYLDEHPKAMDTLEGISKWWLERQQVRLAVQTIAGTLTRLVARGELEELGPQSNPLYRRKNA
jgi:hypothetical protein